MDCKNSTLKLAMHAVQLKERLLLLCCIIKTDALCRDTFITCDNMLLVETVGRETREGDNEGGRLEVGLDDGPEVDVTAMLDLTKVISD